jgi:hypothetical protein
MAHDRVLTIIDGFISSVARACSLTREKAQAEELAAGKIT